MSVQKLLEQNNAFIFDLDNVVYPEKDYLLQVYYLFSQFIEYAEQISAVAILETMKELYESEGHQDIFSKTAVKHHIADKYQVNFDLLMKSVRLPLKLILFDRVLLFLQNAIARGCKIFLFPAGDPEMQLNKIKQTEWNGIEANLTVYFPDELKDSTATPLQYLLDEHQLQTSKVVFIGGSTSAQYAAEEAGLKYLHIDKLMTH